MLALPRWDGEYASTSFSLCKEIAKSHPVFYIDNPFTVKDFLWQYQQPRVKARTAALLFGRNIYHPLNLPGSDLTIVTPRLVAPINWVENDQVYDMLSKLNNKLVSKVLSSIVKDHQLTEYIFINSFNPFYVRSFPANFKPSLFIYHTVDDISEASYVQKHGSRLEKEISQRADFTLVTSLKLKKLKEQDTQKVYYLPNAADTAIFHTALSGDLPMPKDMPLQDQDIVIFTGHLDQRIDVLLLEQIAITYPEKILLLVGPNSLKKEETKRLATYQNIVFTGKKQLEELPGYLQSAKCAIIPFKCNTLTESIYPLKINEYLAAGLPVVSTSFSEDIQAFADLAYISESGKQFIKNIQRAIDEDAADLKARRVEEAGKNTWEHRTSQLYQLIEENLNAKYHEIQKI